MGKYVEYKVAGYWMYYTSHCLNEGIIHVHATDKGKLSEAGSAKIWVHSDGTSTVAKRGLLNDRDLLEIQDWIFDNIDIIDKEWYKNNMGGEYKNK